MEEEGCTLEKQMLKRAIAAALHRVTQLSGHGFANVNAVQLSVSMKLMN